MKYLLLFACLALTALSQDTDINEDVSREFNLELNSVVECVATIKFRPSKGSKSYYHVVPREYENKLTRV